MTLPPDIEDSPEPPTLRELLDRGPLPIGLSLEIARQVLLALESLHRQGATRYEISPESLVLTRDFTGAPRIELKEPGAARSASSDIHSFGVLLYELLTGVHPFQGRTEPLSFAVSDPQRRIPLDLRAIVLTAIAEDPQGRFESAGALAAELAKIQERLALGEAARRAAAETPAAAPGPAARRTTRLPHQTSSRAILPRLLVLGAVLALLLSIWLLLTRKDVPPAVDAAAPAARAEAPAALAEMAPPVPAPAPAELPAAPPADRPEVRREPEPAPARPARKPSAPKPSPPASIAGGRETFESESAVPLEAPAPRYPEEARGTGTRAEIVVGVTIDEAGAVRSPTIETSRVRGSAPAALFHEAALAAARRTRYRPATERGVAVRSWSTLTYRFE